MKRFLGIVTASILAANAFAGIRFNEGDINPEDEILFTVRQDFPGTWNYSSLIQTSVRNTAKSRVLTSFPEQMELLDNGKTLQVRNRYGISRLDLTQNSFRWNTTWDNFPSGASRISPYAVSPDGKWFCYIQKTAAASGFLVVENARTGKRKTLDPKATFSYDSVPVKWSRDSSIFIYEKNGAVYFCNPDGFLKGIEVTENYRKIGEGTINSVNFAGEKNIIYIDRDLIYKIGVKEIYTTGLYSQIIGKGIAIGRLPYSFNPHHDIFSCNDMLNSIFVVQNGRIFTSYKINSPLCDFLDVEYSGPFTDSKSSLLDVNIFWSNDTIPVAWVRSLPYDGKKIMAKAYGVTEKLQKIVELEDSGLPALSPDGRKVAFYSGDKVFIYDTSTWKKLGELEGDRIISLLWKDNFSLFAGGEKLIRLWDSTSNKVSLVFLSSADNGFYTEEGDLYAVQGSLMFVLEKDKYVWKQAKSVKHQNVNANGRYRIFAGETKNQNFENALYIRTLTGKPVTKPVYEKSVEKNQTRKNVALLFDAYDSPEGLSRILYELRNFKVKGTFFLNGEFIRRYPNETRQICYSGNECASMFFTTSDLTSKSFIINEEFIRRGLARTEDEFFQCTKKEMSLMWHAPDYKADENIISFGKKAGYTYVNTKVKNSDRVTLEQAVLESKKYVTPQDLIEEILTALEINEGGAVPVTVGISGGSRTEYLYDYLPLLIGAIVDAGYTIVPAKLLQ